MMVPDKDKGQFPVCLDESEAVRHGGIGPLASHASVDEIVEHIYNDDGGIFHSVKGLV
jgi:hypothetical protein